MQTLQVKKDQVFEAYRNADHTGKALLQQLFGDTISLNITDRVKSFEDACAALGINPGEVVPNGGLSVDAKSTAAYCKLVVIARALNEGWTPNWDDEDEYKYYPWFYMDSDSGFVLLHVTYYYTLSNVGSRLCFKTRELAEYAAKQFESIYKDFFTL